MWHLNHSVSMAPQAPLEPTPCCNIGSGGVSSHLPIAVLLPLLFPRCIAHRARSETSPCGFASQTELTAGSWFCAQFTGKTKNTLMGVLCFGSPSWTRTNDHIGRKYSRGSRLRSPRSLFSPNSPSLHLPPAALGLVPVNSLTRLTKL